MSNPDMTSLSQLEVPPAVKHILRKLEDAQLVRAKQEVAEQLDLIHKKVNKILEHSRLREEIEKEVQSEMSLTYHVDDMEKRDLILEKLTNLLETSAVTQQNLEQVLHWLSNVADRHFKDQASLMTDGDDALVNIDRWITDKEILLSQWLDFIQQCLAKLIDVFSLMSDDEEVPTIQNKKTGGPKDALWEWWNEGTLEAKIKDMQVLSLEKMLEDEETVFIKSAEILTLLQECTAFPYGHKVKNTVFQYIIRILSNLSQAYHIRSKELHHMESKIKARETHELELKDEYSSLSTELRNTQVNITGLKKHLRVIEAIFGCSQFVSAPLIGQLNKDAPRQVDRSQQCDRVPCADIGTQAPGKMSATGQITDDCTLPADCRIEKGNMQSLGSQKASQKHETHGNVQSKITTVLHERDQVLNIFASPFLQVSTRSFIEGGTGHQSHSKIPGDTKHEDIIESQLEEEKLGHSVQDTIQLTENEFIKLQPIPTVQEHYEQTVPLAAVQKRHIQTLTIPTVQDRYVQTVNIPTVQEHYVQSVAIPTVQEHYVQTMPVPTVQENYVQTVPIPTLQENYAQTVPIPTVQENYEQTMPIPTVQDHYEQTVPIPTVQEHYEQTMPISTVQDHYEQTMPIPTVQDHYEQTVIILTVQDHYEQTVPIPTVQDHYEQTVPIPTVQEHYKQTMPIPTQDHYEQTVPIPTQDHYEQTVPIPTVQDHYEQAVFIPTVQEHYEQTVPIPTQDHYEQTVPIPTMQERYEQTVPIPKGQDHYEQTVPIPTVQEHYEQTVPIPTVQDHYEQTVPIPTVQDRYVQTMPIPTGQDHYEQTVPIPTVQDHYEQTLPIPTVQEHYEQTVPIPTVQEHYEQTVPIPTVQDHYEQTVPIPTVQEHYEQTVPIPTVQDRYVQTMPIPTGQDHYEQTVPIPTVQDHYEQTLPIPTVQEHYEQTVPIPTVQDHYEQTVPIPTVQEHYEQTVPIPTVQDRYVQTMPIPTGQDHYEQAMPIPTVQEDYEQTVPIPTVQEHHDKTVIIPTVQEQPMTAVLYPGEQASTDKTDTGRAGEAFLQDINYLLDQKSASIDLTQKMIQKKETFQHLDPDSQGLYSITETKIDDTMLKVKEGTLQGTSLQNMKQEPPDDEAMVFVSEFKELHISHLQPEALTKMFTKDNKYVQTGQSDIQQSEHPQSSIHFTKDGGSQEQYSQPDDYKDKNEFLRGETFPKRLLKELVFPGDIQSGGTEKKYTDAIMDRHPAGRRDIYEEDEEDMDLIYKHTPAKQIFDKDPPQYSKEDHFYPKHLVHDLKSQSEKLVLSSPEALRTKQSPIVLSAENGEEDEQYYIDVRAQRTNLDILKKAKLKRIISPQLQSHATDLILQAFEMDLTRLGNLFRKYTSSQMIQKVRENLISRLSRATQLGKEHERENLCVFLRKLDEYHRKILQRWTNRQTCIEQERNKCLSTMFLLFKKLKMKWKINLSCPCQLLQIGQCKEEQVQRSFNDRLSKWTSCPRRSGQMMSQYSTETTTTSFLQIFRKPIHGRREAIWKTEVVNNSFRLDKKQAMLPTGSRMGVSPDIPHLLELDVSLTRKKTLRHIKTTTMFGV